MISNKIINKYIIFLFVIALLCSFIPLTDNGHTIAQASEEFNFETNPIEKDLLGATVDGKAFNFDDFPKDEKGSATVLTLVEYGYSASSNKDFGLYLYVYNPTGNPISNLSGPASQNKVNICIERDAYGEASQYDLHVLSYLDSTDDKLFYKFKIVQKDIGDGKTLYDTLAPNERKYDIIEIELKSVGADGSNNAISYDVGFRYSYKGYQKGYDDSAKDNSTIACTVSKNLERLNLDVYHTVYRTNSSDKGSYYKNQINSCWFAIPNEVYSAYEHIDYIKANWWEFYTKLAFVTNNKSVYESLLKGTKTNNINSVNRDFYSLRYGYQRASDFSEYIDSAIYDWGYNVLPDTEVYGVYQAIRRYDSIESMIPLAFYDEDLNVDIDTVRTYFNSYKNDLGNGYIDVNGREISKDLFDLNYTDDGFNQGYNLKEIKFGDTFDLISYADSHSAWERFIDYGWTQPLNEDSLKDLEYIKVVEDDDFSFETISDDLLIGKSEAQSFYDFYTAHKKTHKVVLLRFGVSDDYWSHNVEVFEYTNENNYIDTNSIINSAEEGSSYPAYIANERVYLDFDIIQINFMKDGKSIAIPVSSSPNDSIGGIEQPEDESFDNTLNNLKDDIDDSLNDLIEKLKTWFDSLFDSLSDSMQSFLEILKWIGIGLACVLVLVLLGWLISWLVKLFKPINKAINKAKKRSRKRKSSSSKKSNNRVKPPRI